MAVYTPVTLEEARAHLAAHYALGDIVSLDPISEGVENTNYLLRTTQGKFILTLFEKRVSPRDLPFMLEFMSWLTRAGIACPLPVADKNSRLLIGFKGKSSVILTFLEGKAAAEITGAHTYLLGALAACMHDVGHGVPFKDALPNPLSLSGWQVLYEKLGASLDRIAPGLAHEVEEELRYLEANWPKGLPTGLIHADLFPDNVFFKAPEGRLTLSGVIDFYFSCTDFFAYDLAICLNAWCFDAAQAYVPELGTALFEGYAAIDPPLEEELQAFPTLARGAALRFLLTRAYDWLNPVEGAVVTPKDPMEYVKKLRFHQGVTHYSDYGMNFSAA